MGRSPMAQLYGIIWCMCLAVMAMTVEVHRSSLHKHKPSRRFAWTSPTQDTVNALVVSPSENLVYAGSSDANIYSLDSSTGDRHWTLPWAPVRSLAIDAEGNYLYAGHEYGLLGFNVSHRPWNFTNSGGAQSVAASGEFVYAGSQDNYYVYALRASDGQRMWNFSAGGPVQSLAASPSGDSAYAGSNSLYALRTSDGSRIWNITLGNNWVSSLATNPSGDIVYSAWGYDKTVYARRALDGQFVWNFTAGGVVSSVASPSGDFVYAWSDDMNVYALRALDGQKVWNFTARDYVLSMAPSPSGDFVYVGSKDTHVYALRASDGHQVWNFKAEDWVESVAASPSGDFVYVGSRDRNVYALRVSNGSKVWNFTAGNVVSSVAASPSGDFVYAGSDDTNVYVLRASDGKKLGNFTAGAVKSVAVSPSNDTLNVVAGQHVFSRSSYFPIQYTIGAGSSVCTLVRTEHPGRLYGGTDDGGILALGEHDQMWSTSIRGHLHSITVHTEGKAVYAGSNRGFCKLRVHPTDGRTLWNFKAGGGVQSVAASGEFVYAGSQDNYVYALRASDGQRLWNFSAGGPVQSLAASPSGDFVYAGSNSLYALRTSNGSRIWNITLGYHWVSSVTTSPSGDNVYSAWGYDETVYARRALDGQFVWNFKAGNIVASVAASGDYVYAGVRDTVYVLRASNGQTISTFTAGFSNLRAATTTGALDILRMAVDPAGDFVYVGSFANEVNALRTSNGQKLWNITADAQETSMAASPSGDFLYVGVDVHVYTLRASDGQNIWNFTAGAAVLSVAASGDCVCAGTMDGNVYALSECTFLLRSRVTASALSPSGGVVYAGSIDHHVYAINTSDGRQLWRFDQIKGGVISLAVDSNASTVYAGSYDRHIYALTTDGALRWKHKVESVARCLAVSPVGDLLYAGLDNFSVYALHTHDEPREDVDWDAIYAWIGAGIGGLLVVLWLASRCIPGMSGPVHFGVAGSIFGWVLGAVTGYAMILLPKEVQSSVATFTEDHGGMRWLVHAPGYYGFSIIACTLVMATIWALAAWTRKPLQLTHLCSALLLISTLCLAYNLVPGLWLVYSRASTRRIYLGSRPWIFIAWWVCSYFVGLVYLVIGVALLDALYKGAERGARTWRGHSYTRWLVLLPAFHWGFFIFWCSTAAAMFLSGNHGVFVPPCSPLIILGVGVGLISFGFQLVSRATDKHGWARDRALELASYVTWWPWARDASLRREWQKLTDDILGAFSLRKFVELFLSRKVVQLCMNAWCPEWCRLHKGVSACKGPRDWCGLRKCVSACKGLGEWCGLRKCVSACKGLGERYGLRKCVSACTRLRERCGLCKRVSACKGLRLTSVQGCQQDFKDEVTWSFLHFTATSLLAVMPLLALWLNTRFNMNEPQTLSLSDYRVCGPGPRGESGAQGHLPIPFVGNASLSYFPLVFESEEPFLRCRWTDIERAVDPGNFNLCLNDTASTCLLYGCDWPKCLGLTKTIQAEPSSSIWSNVQLAVYIGFLLVCIWTIHQEADEKLHVLVAFNNHRIYEHNETWGKWRWWTRSVIILVFLCILAGIDVMCLHKHEASQRYYIFSNPRDLQQWSRKGVSRFGLERGMYYKKGALAWYCDASDFDHGPPRILEVTYSTGKNVMIALAVVQGMYFFYQCYSLLSKQKKLYDFVDGDVLISTRSKRLWTDCSYGPIHQIREKGNAMSREDIAKHLYRTVYAPFLCKVWQCRPDLIQSLFNEKDVEDVLRICHDQESKSDEDGDEKSERPFPWSAGKCLIREEVSCFRREDFF